MSIRSYAFAALGALALACQSARAAAPSNEPSAVAPRASQPALAANVTPAPAGAPDFASVAERILPSVVSIHVKQDVEQSAAERPSLPSWPYRRFRGFGNDLQLPAASLREGVGSGFVIDPAGLILTNHHVVADAQRDRGDARHAGRAAPDAERQGHRKAPDFDVALLKTEGSLDVPALTFADSDRLRVGEWVMAIGNPFGLSQSMSVGIISGKHRGDMNRSIPATPAGRSSTWTGEWWA